MSGESRQIRDWLSELPKVAVAHATFQKAISGEPGEDALAYPVQSFLNVRREHRIIVPQEDHPFFAKKLGRPQQLDLVGVNRTSGNWSFAMEIKIFDGTKRDRLVRDLVKLLLLSEAGRKCQNASKYFLIVVPISSKEHKSLSFTEQGGPVQSVWRRGEPSENLFDVLLPWKLPEIRFWIGDLAPQLQKEFRQAMEEFKVEKMRGDIKVRRINVAWSEDFASGLWKLDWKNPRKDFFPENGPAGLKTDE
jgi:hypothetical protein